MNRNHDFFAQNWRQRNQRNAGACAHEVIGFDAFNAEIMLEKGISPDTGGPFEHWGG